MRVEPQDVLARMPEWAGTDASISVLVGGLANRSYVATAGGERCVVKILTEAMDEFGLMIRIPDLIHNSIAAGESGVAPRVLASFPDMPAVVIEFIEGRTFEPKDLSVAENIPRLGDAVRRFHAGAGRFANEISIWTFLDRYLGLVERHELRVPYGVLDALPTIRRIEDSIAVRRLSLVSSHNDLLARNIMDDGDIRLIDYDFSGRNDPCFDLGDLAMEGDYDPDQLEALCRAYFGGPDRTQTARAELYGIAAQYTWTLLFAAMDQLLTEKPDESFDYWQEAGDRWLWTEGRLGLSSLGSTIDAARAG